jgi:hypothetical protein
MFLCSLCGKIYSDDTISLKVLLKQKDSDSDTVKELSTETCCLCYGLLNTKYIAGINNTFEVPPKDKVKIFKISSTYFENKNKEKKDKKTEEKINEKPTEKKITEILTKVKKDEKVKSKKSKSSLQ